MADGPGIGKRQRRETLHDRLPRDAAFRSRLIASRVALRLAELLAGRDCLPGTGKLLVNETPLDRLQALCDRLRKKTLHRPLGLPQPRAQPGRRRHKALEAHGGHRLRNCHVEPRPCGPRGGGARGGASRHNGESRYRQPTGAGSTGSASSSGGRTAGACRRSEGGGMWWRAASCARRWEVVTTNLICRPTADRYANWSYLYSAGRCVPQTTRSESWCRSEGRGGPSECRRCGVDCRHQFRRQLIPVPPPRRIDALPYDARPYRANSVHDPSQQGRGGSDRPGHGTTAPRSILSADHYTDRFSAERRPSRPSWRSKVTF